MTVIKKCSTFVVILIGKFYILLSVYLIAGQRYVSMQCYKRISSYTYKIPYEVSKKVEQIVDRIPKVATI